MNSNDAHVLIQVSMVELFGGKPEVASPWTRKEKLRSHPTLATSLDNRFCNHHNVVRTRCSNRNMRI
jgi:hypothetical protein